MAEHRRVQRSIHGALLALSLSGTLIALWAHVSAVFGGDPGLEVRDFWVVQLVLFGLLMPIMAELFLNKKHEELLRSPRWMRISLYLLLAYYAANFYLFLYWAADHLTSRSTWQMFSSGWLLLFAVSAVYYQVRFSEANKRTRSR